MRRMCEASTPPRGLGSRESSDSILVGLGHDASLQPAKALLKDRNPVFEKFLWKPLIPIMKKARGNAPTASPALPSVSTADKEKMGQDLLEMFKTVMEKRGVMEERWRLTSCWRTKNKI